MPAIVRERRKQEEPSNLTIQLLGTDQPKIDPSKPSRSSFSPSHGSVEKIETSTQSSGRFASDTNLSKDIAIVRYALDPEKYKQRTIGDNCQVVNEQTFLAIMNKSKKNDYWKSVECIQTCLKTSLGIGHHFIVQFEAHPNKKDPFEPLDYQHSKFKSDEYLIKKNL